MTHPSLVKLLPRRSSARVPRRPRYAVNWHQRARLVWVGTSQPRRWQTELGEDKDRELIVDGRKSVWICELGHRATDGEFAEFVERIAAAPVEVSDLQVTYESPSQGRLEFGWTGPLMQKDVAAALL